MSDVPNLSCSVKARRLLHASPQEVFAAFEQPELLAQWWGPDGFTNTFECFEFRPDGRWIFVMHGPNGANYPNESVFRELVRGATVVIEHLSKPWFKLTVSLADRHGMTQLEWVQEFESAEMAANMRALCETANEQVLDRLQSVLSGRVS